MVVHLCHIPKTGGTALRWGLDGYVVKHTHNETLADIPDPAIVILRDPVDRFVSCYDWTRYHIDMPPWANVDEAALAIRTMRDDQMPLRYIFWPMRRWVGNDIGRCAYVARTETLDRDYGAIKALFGVPTEMRLPPPGDERRNELRWGVPRPHPPNWKGKSVIGPEGISAIHERYADDYALLRELARQG